MVEQNVKSALKLADEAIALESGRLALHKRADELLARSEYRAAISGWGACRRVGNRLKEFLPSDEKRIVIFELVSR